MHVHQHCCLLEYFTELWIFAMMILCALSPEQAYSLKITSDNDLYYGTRDRNVSLNCQFSLDSEDLENLDIEWNIVPPNRKGDEKRILRYSQSIIHNTLYAPLKNRIYFTSPEPQDGDASLSITDLKLTDSGTYQCKVRKSAREQIKDIFLFVMERPDKPVCYMDGEAVLDRNIRLRCKSSQGTPPLKYRWKKRSGNRMLPSDAFVDAQRGDLYLDQISEKDFGAYRCTVQNRVGMENCKLILKITSPSTVTDGHGPIAGTTAGITAGVGIEDYEPIPNITSPSTVIDGHGPIAGTTAGITAEVGMEDCEPVLNVTSPSTVIDRHGPTAGTTAGAIVAVIVLITVTLTPVIYYRRRIKREMLRRNAYIWAQRKPCIHRPIRIEQLRCEEEENLYEVMQTTNLVLSSSAEDNEKNASIEEGLSACIEAKDLCSSQIEKSEDNGSMGNRDQADTEGSEPRSLHTEDENDVEGQEPCSLHKENEKNASHLEVTTAL